MFTHNFVDRHLLAYGTVNLNKLIICLVVWFWMQFGLFQDSGGWIAELSSKVREICLLTRLIQAEHTCSYIHCLHEEITL